MKEQGKTPEKEQNKMEISSQSDRVQCKGHKDAHGTQKKNGQTQWECQQRDTKYKKEPTITDQYNT